MSWYDGYDAGAVVVAIGLAPPRGWKDSKIMEGGTKKEMPERVSIRPSEMVEGGGAPVDRNLTVKEARFVFFDYVNKAGEKVATTAAARLKMQDDDGGEYEQHYSAADPAKFAPSRDGKELLPVGAGSDLSKSSNFFVLMSNLVSAGFPENRLGSDISVLDGLHAYWVGIPEPPRPGLVRAATDQRQRIILVPSQIHRMPWEKGKPGAKTPAAAVADGDALALAMAFIGKVIPEGESMTRQELAARVFGDLAQDASRDAIASTIFGPAIKARLLAEGFSLEGETISR